MEIVPDISKAKTLFGGPMRCVMCILYNTKLAACLLQKIRNGAGVPLAHTVLPVTANRGAAGLFGRPRARNRGGPEVYKTFWT
jgi:hypothetical protein